jgi:hypothetical protein
MTNATAADAGERVGDPGRAGVAAVSCEHREPRGALASSPADAEVGRFEEGAWRDARRCDGAGP